MCNVILIFIHVSIRGYLIIFFFVYLFWVEFYMTSRIYRGEKNSSQIKLANFVVLERKPSDDSDVILHFIKIKKDLGLGCFTHLFV